LSPQSPSDEDVLVPDSSTDVTLSCNVGAVSDSKIVWTQDGVEIDRGINQVTVRGGTTGRRYSCIVENEAGSAADFINIHVADSGKPFINRAPREKPTTSADSVNVTIGRPDVRVRQGQKLTIACTAQGQPDPAISWSVDGQPIVTDHSFVVNSDGSLVIRSVRLENEGSYTCSAINRNGEDTTTIDVQVLTTPVIDKQPRPSPPSPPSSGSVMFNPNDRPRVLPKSNFTLTCPASGRPKPQVTWELPDGSKLVRGGSKDRATVLDDGSLIVYDAESRDTGVYRCLVSSDGGSDDVDFDVDIVARPRLIQRAGDNVTIDGTIVKPWDEDVIIARRNSDISLSCTVVSAPASSIRWTKDGLVLTDGNGVSITTVQRGPERASNLMISQATLSDSGSYSCVATNPYGSDASSIDIVVARNTMY
jgi:hemicentin